MEEERSTSQPLTPGVVPLVPAAYFEDGYLLLTLSTRKGRVHFYSTREGGKSYDWPFPEFTARMRYPADPPINPYRLALNILAQKRNGTLRIRARDERKILSILEANREELLNLTPEQLGREYARIVGKTPPDPSDKDRMVKELLMQVKEEVAKEEKKEQEAAVAAPAAEGAKPEGGEAATSNTNSEGAAPVKKNTSKKKSGAKPSVAPTKEDLARYAKAGKKDEKKGAKKPAAKAPAKKAAKAEPKPKGKTPKEKKEGEGPFRAGSKKADAYAFFKKCGGDREKVIEHTVKLGCTESTAKSWFAVFTRTKG